MSSFLPSLLVMGVCSIQWFFIGYTLAYGDGSGVIGDFKHFMHQGVLAEPVGTIPAILFSEFQYVNDVIICVFQLHRKLTLLDSSFAQPFAPSPSEGPVNVED